MLSTTSFFEKWFIVLLTQSQQNTVSLVIPREAESILCGMTEMDAVAS